MSKKSMEKISNLWIKIGRMGRKPFAKINLYMILLLVLSVCILIPVGMILSVILYFTLVSGGGGISVILVLAFIFLLLMFIYLLSIFFLAKRFQDCGICGIRAPVSGIIFPLTGVYLPKTIIFYGFNFTGIYLYLLLVVVMCFIKGDIGPNKYGNVDLCNHKNKKLIH